MRTQLINDKQWYWCDQCRGWVWSDGAECPTGHFTILSLEPTISNEEREFDRLCEMADTAMDVEKEDAV